MIKTVRIWNGEKPMVLVAVDDETETVTFAPGSSSAGAIDIDLDPWAGIVTGDAVSGVVKLTPGPPAT
jgi:hypothetical protein